MSFGKKTGGRVKGTLNKFSKVRLTQLEAAKAGITPLEVMLKNMRYADEAADKAAAMLPSLSEREERVIVMNEVRTNKQRAQEAAKDAAPYMHSRLSAIEHGSDAKKPMRMLISWEGEGDDQVPEGISGKGEAKLDGGGDKTG